MVGHVLLRPATGLARLLEPSPQFARFDYCEDVFVHVQLPVVIMPRLLPANREAEAEIQRPDGATR